jgi:hypothetical protein
MMPTSFNEAILLANSCHWLEKFLYDGTPGTGNFVNLDFRNWEVQNLPEIGASRKNLREVSLICVSTVSGFCIAIIDEFSTASPLSAPSDSQQRHHTYLAISFCHTNHTLHKTQNNSKTYWYKNFRCSSPLLIPAALMICHGRSLAKVSSVPNVIPDVPCITVILSFLSFS